MPKARFNVNLGSRDAAALGLDFQQCTKDSVHDVSKETFDALKKVGEFVVSEVDEPRRFESKPAKPADVK